MQVTTAATAQNTVVTTANTVAETANTVATNANTVATKSWNVVKAISKALLGDFTGLLLVGAGALATYAIATANTADEQDKLNAVGEKSKSLIDMQAEAHNEISKSIDAEKYHINALIAVINNVNTAYDDKVKALNQLKTIIPSVNGEISAESVYHGNAVTEIRKHIAALDDLQKALAAFKLGQKIQEEVTTAEWEKFQADNKVNRQRTKVQQSTQQVRETKGQTPTDLQTLSYNPFTQSDNTRTPKIKAQEKQLNADKTELKAAETESNTANEKLKVAQQKQNEFKQFNQLNGGSAKA